MNANTIGMIAIIAIGIHGILFAIYSLKVLREIKNRERMRETNNR